MFNGNFNEWALEHNQPDQLIEVSQAEFEAMRDSIDESISRDAAGLDDIILKKMILTFNTGKYSRNTDIILELTQEEADALKDSDTLPEAFSVKKGKDLKQLDLNALDIAANRVATFFDTLFGGGNVFDSEIYENAKDEREDKQEKNYLHTKGVLVFYSQEYDSSMSDEEKKECELVYYDEEALKKLYIDEFQANRYGAKRDYAASVWEYLSTKCYTDGDNNTEMKIYCHETVEEELVEWTFSPEDADNASFADIITDFGDKTLSNISINRQKINEYYLYDATEWINDTKDLGFLGEIVKDSDGYILGMDGIVDTAKKSYDTINIEYYSLVSGYTAPVEFMIDLLNISSSKDFVDAFIDKVTAETEVALKLYRVSNSSSKEVTEKTKEITNVYSEAVFSAEIVAGYIDKSLAVDEGGEIKQVTEEVTEGKEGIKFSYEWTGNNKVKMSFKDIPSKYERLKVKITFKSSGTTKEYYIPSDQWLDGDPLGTSETVEITPSSFFGLASIDRYKVRSSEATIAKCTTKLTTETKLDIAVEEAKTWYGTYIYDNYIQMDQVFESENAYGSRIPSNGSPTMHTITKSKATYNRNNSNSNTIFKQKNLGDYVWAEVGSRIEKWYSGLGADDIAFWVVPGGHLTHSLVTMYGDQGLQLYESDEELLNIQFTYAMENGPADWWINKYYFPVKMEVEYQNYQKGILYETVDRYLVEGTVTVQENTDCFLSLLKNNTGTYNKDQSYNPNGKEVVYKTIYNSEDRVGKFFETSAEMFFNLLESSPYTTVLADVMRYTLYQYTTKDYGVTEFNYEIISREGFEYI